MLCRGRSLISLLDSLCNAVDTQPIMCRRIGIVFRRKGKYLKERERGDEDGSDDDDAFKTLVLRFAAFADGMRLIFPHALERELEDLWKHIDRKQKGYVSFQSMMKRIIRDERSGSPEPGPTHYNPQFSVVEPKPLAAVILPETVEAEQIPGLPSELFMNYDTFKAVKPRTSSAIFPKRKADASWCNPVAREPDLLPDELLERVDTDSQTAHASVKPRMKPEKPITPRPPRDGQAARPKASVSSSRVQAAGKRIANATMEGVAEETESRDELQNARTAAAAVGNNKDTSSRSPRGTTPRAQPRASFSGMHPSNGRNLFYNDIAPLYLKFLNSKEVQKFMKQ